MDWSGPSGAQPNRKTPRISKENTTENIMSGIISRESIFREQIRESKAREKPVLVPYDNDDVVVD